MQILSALWPLLTLGAGADIGHLVSMIASKRLHTMSNQLRQVTSDRSIDTIGLRSAPPFRPPRLIEHSVTRVEGGSRYVVSIGWVLGRVRPASAIGIS